MEKKERIILRKKNNKKKINSTWILLGAAGILIIIGLVISLIANSSVNKFKEPAKKVNPNQTAVTVSGPAATTDIIVDTDDWEVYSEGKAEFSFKYPPEIELGSPDTESNKMTISVASRPIDELDSGTSLFRYTKKKAKDDRDALENGDPGINFPEMYDESLEAVEIADGDAYAKSFMVLSQDALCDVTFEKVLVFYNNKNQVIVTLTGPKKTFLSQVRQFFENDTTNCEPNERVWTMTGQKQFNDLIAQGTAPIAVQNWADAFNNITGTITLEASTDASSATKNEPEPVNENANENNSTETSKINFREISN